LEIDEPIDDPKYNWNKSANAEGKDIYVTFSDFENEIKKWILKNKSVTTTVILDELKKEEPCP
jgi:hypothetical protein